MSWYNPFSWTAKGAAESPLGRDVVNPIAGGAAEAAGAISGDKGLTQLGHNITNPSVNYLGNTNPGYSAPTQQVQPQTGTSTIDLGGTNAGTAGAGGPGGGAAGTTAGTNANGGAANFLQSSFMPALNQLQSSYNTIFGAGGVYPTAAGQAAANIQQGYTGQIGNLNNQFAQSQTQLPWEYAARGAANSGWAGNAYQSAQNQYNNSMQQMNSAESKDIANVYQQMQGLQNQNQDQLNAFNNPEFQAMLSNAPSYIQSEQLANLLQDQANLGYTQGANTPISQALQGISNNPSYQDQAAGTLKAQLQALSQSGAPISVQNQIAQGIIGNPSNPTNSNFLNYWQQLQNNPQNPTIQAV